MQTSDGDEERVLRTIETKLTQEIGSLWFFPSVAVFLIASCVLFSITADMHRKENWVLFIGVCSFAAFLAYLSVVSWQITERHRALLMQLQVDESKAALEQPGVWPPPPSITAE